MSSSCHRLWNVKGKGRGEEGGEVGEVIVTEASPESPQNWKWSVVWAPVSPSSRQEVPALPLFIVSLLSTSLTFWIMMILWHRQWSHAVLGPEVFGERLEVLRLLLENNNNYSEGEFRWVTKIGITWIKTFHMLFGRKFLRGSYSSCVFTVGLRLQRLH